MTASDKPILVVKVGAHVMPQWLELLARQLPDVNVQPWTTADPTTTDYAAVWRPEHGRLAAMPRLKGVVSIAAGADHILEDPDAPRHVPIVRCTGAPLQARMAEYVVLHALRHLRRASDIERAQAQRQWQPLSTAPASESRIGIMGMGVLGQACVNPLRAVGFEVIGWTRSARADTPYKLYTGSSGLDKFLAQTNTLVCLLPSTVLTRNIIDTELLYKLPAGATVINVARGDLLVEDDLIGAIDDGHIREATLDVFREEPLPEDHAFWAHEKIHVTPHIASLIDAKTGSKLVADHIRRFVDGAAPCNVVDIDQGY